VGKNSKYQRKNLALINGEIAHLKQQISDGILVIQHLDISAVFTAKIPVGCAMSVHYL